MTIADQILEGATDLDPEFEVRVYDILGRLLAVLPMERDGEDYQSERYTGSKRMFTIITLFRNGSGVQVLAYGLEIHPGFFARAWIPDPHKAMP